MQSTLRAGELRINSHNLQHRALLPYTGLMLWLKRADPSGFLQLQTVSETVLDWMQTVLQRVMNSPPWQHGPIGHVNVQNCLLINFQYKPISFQRKVWARCIQINGCYCRICCQILTSSLANPVWFLSVPMYSCMGNIRLSINFIVALPTHCHRYTQSHYRRSMSERLAHSSTR